jgi:hypothetical protein
LIAEASTTLLSTILSNLDGTIAPSADAFHFALAMWAKRPPNHVEEESRMSSNQHRECPDCTGPLDEIRILDTESAITRKTGLFDLVYTAPDAERSFWGGKIPVSGDVSAWICGKCHRILLYGVPRDS